MKRLVQFFVLLLGLAGSSHAAERPPNIVFILIDDLGWTDLGCAGSKFYQTPEIDRLAASGMRFTQAYAACAVCSPTRAALLTGQYPARMRLTDWIPGEIPPTNCLFRIPDWTQHLPAHAATLPKSLKRLGYVTAHIGKWHIGGGEFMPQYQGFDLNIAGGETGHPASYFWPYGSLRNIHRVPELAARGGRPGDYLTDQLTEEALHFIEANKAKPFYLNFCHYAVHVPLQGKTNLVEEAGKIPGNAGQSNAVYSAMVHSVDQSVGRILNKLDELNLSSNTVVVFTSDNGGAVHTGRPPATSNWPLRLGKGYAYEGGLRIPLIIRVPGVTQPGSVCTVPVISMDFFPTFLQLAGADSSTNPPIMDGATLLPLLRGDKTFPRDELFWHYPHYWFVDQVSPYSIIRKGNWKLIRFYETRREELYDLDNDLSELHDLSQSNPQKRQQLTSRLDAWLSEVNAQLPIPKTNLLSRNPERK